jgi:CBS domain-containing protein
MATVVADVMTSGVQTVEAQAPVEQAAARMRDSDTGAVVVLEGGRVTGILTDRDIAVRVVAEGKPAQTPVREACSSGELVTVTPETTISDAVSLMSSHAVRRLPVVEGDRPVGVVSLGDLAIERDPASALADISAAPGNR